MIQPLLCFPGTHPSGVWLSVKVASYLPLASQTKLPFLEEWNTGKYPYQQTGLNGTVVLIWQPERNAIFIVPTVLFNGYTLS